MRPPPILWACALRSDGSDDGIRSSAVTHKRNQTRSFSTPLRAANGRDAVILIESPLYRPSGRLKRCWHISYQCFQTTTSGNAVNLSFFKYFPPPFALFIGRPLRDSGSCTREVSSIIGRVPCRLQKPTYSSPLLNLDTRSKHNEHESHMLSIVASLGRNRIRVGRFSESLPQ